MGFFSSIGKAIRNAAKFVGKVVVKPVHAVAKAVHSVTSPIVKTVKKVIKSVAKHDPTGIVKRLGKANMFGININDALNLVDKGSTALGDVVDLTDQSKSIGERYSSGKSLYSQFKRGGKASE